MADYPGCEPGEGADQLVATCDQCQWIDLFVSAEERQLHDPVVADHFVSLEDYGAPTLGTCPGPTTSSGSTRPTREKYEIGEHRLGPYLAT